MDHFGVFDNKTDAKFKSRPKIEEGRPVSSIGLELVSAGICAYTSTAQVIEWNHCSYQYFQARLWKFYLLEVDLYPLHYSHLGQFKILTCSHYWETRFFFFPK